MRKSGWNRLVSGVFNIGRAIGVPKGIMRDAQWRLSGGRFERDVCKGTLVRIPEETVHRYSDGCRSIMP